jgi:hypothetical protein
MGTCQPEPGECSWMFQPCGQGLPSCCQGPCTSPVNGFCLGG